VLVADGASAELYDPTTGTWSATGGSMSINGINGCCFTATLLKDGTVLVAGLDDSTTAELYDPTTGTWSVAGNMSVARPYSTATRLEGGRVLVAGGFPGGGTGNGPIRSAEIYSPPVDLASLTLSYNGKLRDRVGQGNTALGPDGALDGTLTATLGAGGGRTITALQLQSTGPGTWDTGANTQYWVLGVAATLDGPLLNDPTTVAVNFPVANGGSFVLFASDYQGIEFVSGTTLTLTASFSDGTTATATTFAP